MARMFPENLNFFDICSQSKQFLYKLFKNKLSDEFTVFHSAKWQVTNFQGKTQKRQTDFIIVSPKLGILILEVQEGEIEYNNHQWYMNKQLTQDPFSQACDSKYSLLTLLKNRPFWLNKSIVIGHAVAFPDLTINHNLGVHAPSEIILDQPQLFRLEDWTKSVMIHWQQKSDDQGELGQQAIPELINVFEDSVALSF